MPVAPARTHGAPSGSLPAFRPRPLHLAVSIVAFSALASIVPAVSAELPLCEGEPLFITEECADPRFNTPVIDVDEVRDNPVPHRYVNGHFADTDLRFSFYFPLEGYDGRFFQFTHQLNTSENASSTNIRFAIDSGAYLVQTNMGGDEAIRSVEAALVDQLDPTVVGYRANAAGAKFSRKVAADLFGEHRPYGYLSGGSGGAYQTIASMQNTTVWDGGVPHVMGSPQSTPNHGAARIHALRILRDGDVNVFPDIMDAIDPGGSGDPYATLNEEQREALEEVTLLGFPMRGWFSWPTMGAGALPLIAGYVPFLDPDYFADFWEVPGYLGHDDPYGSVAASVVVHDTTVSGVSGSVVLLTEPPQGSVGGAQLVVNSGELSGEQFTIFSVVPSGLFVFGNVSALASGDEVTIDNRDALALQTYYRHQVPDKERYAELAAPLEFFPELPEIFPHFPGWDQFLDENSNPIYPQRDVLIGPPTVFYGAGSLSTSHFHGKMLGLQSMMDVDAHPWHAIWFRSQVHEAGNGDRYRLYFMDHAPHGANVSGASQAHLVGYRGALEQLLFDLAAWVENGVEPSKETKYTLDGTQVVLPPSASARRGIQPVVHLKANGGERADVPAGQPVNFTGQIQVPQNVGRIVQVEWDFYGTGEFVPGELDRIHPGTVVVRTDHAYNEPGIYFPVLRVTSHRDGDPEATHARVQNLDRARVVVTEGQVSRPGRAAPSADAKR